MNLILKELLVLKNNQKLVIQNSQNFINNKETQLWNT